MNSMEFLKNQTSILMVSAHPDDAEIYAGGVAVLARQLDIPVHFLIMTDGRIGTKGAPKIEQMDLTRYKEQQKSSDILGVTHRIFQLEDGFLESSNRNRRGLINQIRMVRPSLLFTHRLTSGHPDHRACAQLVIDSLPLLDKDNVDDGVVSADSCPIPHVLLYWDDKPPSFWASVVFDVEPVIETKQNSINAHVSQRKRYNKTYPTYQAKQWASIYYTGYKMAEVFEMSPYGKEFEGVSWL